MFAELLAVAPVATTPTTTATKATTTADLRKTGFTIGLLRDEIPRL
jgi:hypothetical protein